MNAIVVPYHLLIPTVLCIVGLVVVLFYRKKKYKKIKVFWICVTVFLVLYLLIVASATYDDIYCQWKLNSYDINKDGIFSGQEITQEQKAAMQKLTNDVGRNFSFISGFIFALTISLIIYIVGLLLSKLKR
jgi:energy-coupling factor transporter transmembrane protein EcfT